MKRSTESIAFKLRKAWEKITTYRPSIWIVGGTIMIISIFLLGGGIYDIIERPIVIGGWQVRILPFYPRGLNEQFLGESIFVMILYALGVSGFILIYQSTKYVYRPRQAYLMLVIVVSIVALTYIFVELSLRQKIGM